MPTHTAFDGTGMWIWYIQKSQGGSPARIAAQAKGHHVRTLFVKSGDGADYWDQFSTSMIRYFHARGLKVCAWQYVYGKRPMAEADVAATAVRRGADCFVIDAEAEYEHRYVAASTYVQRLRAKIGPKYPLALAGFPYVDFHPSFPYSVFLGAGGAQYNQPQMYWHTIGTSVDRNYAHTYTWNRIYGRPIFPLGQTYDHPPIPEIRRFRRLAQAYGAGGVSWWDWQESTTAGWTALGQSLTPPSGPAPTASYPLLGVRSRGDHVVWAQEHLRGAGLPVAVNGIYRGATQRAVREFQTDNGLRVDGQVGPATWVALLSFPAARVVWRTGPTFAASKRADGTLVLPRPTSASLPAVRYELPSKRGRR